MAIYPGAIPTLNEIFQATDYVDWTNAAKWDNLRAELRAALVELGTDPAGIFATVKARLDDIYPQFHDRGDPATHDFTTGDFTKDGTFYDLNLSGIVPAGTKAVLMVVIIKVTSVDKYLILREKGNTNSINVGRLRSQVANIFKSIELTVPCSTDRKIQYAASSATWTVLNLTVKGWWK